MEFTQKPTDVVFLGRVITSAYNDVLASSHQIYDYEMEMPQSEINKLISNGGSQYFVQIFTTNGIILTDTNKSTTLYAQVYLNGENVTDKFNDWDFSWERTSTDGIGDKEWNEQHKNVGKQIVVDSSQIENRTAMFQCNLNIDK